MAEALIVEDDESTRLTLRTILERAGHKTREASDGRKALRSLGRRPADIVLLDVNMPEMDGYAVLESLLQLPDFDAPVVMITAESSTEGLMREAAYGALEHVSKPFTATEVRRTVERVLKAAPEDRAARREMLVRAAATYEAMRVLRSTLTPEEPARRR